MSKQLVIGCDHSARALKAEIAQLCEGEGWQVNDIGTHTDASCDYPLIAEQAGRLVANGDADLGILICGTGIGMSIAANKVPGIRCCVCSEPYSAALSRQHNDANMLAFGARVIGNEMAKLIVRTWLNSAFEGERHQRRVAQINALD